MFKIFFGADLELYWFYHRLNRPSLLNDTSELFDLDSNIGVERLQSHFKRRA